MWLRVFSLPILASLSVLKGQSSQRIMSSRDIVLKGQSEQHASMILFHCIACACFGRSVC